MLFQNPFSPSISQNYPILLSSLNIFWIWCFMAHFKPLPPTWTRTHTYRFLMRSWTSLHTKPLNLAAMTPKDECSPVVVGGQACRKQLFHVTLWCDFSHSRLCYKIYFLLRHIVRALCHLCSPLKYPILSGKMGMIHVMVVQPCVTVSYVKCQLWHYNLAS